MGNVVLLVVALALVGSARPAVVVATPEIVVRVITLKHRSPNEALAVLRPVLTEEASVTVQPKGNTLTVRDSADAVERAARTIAAWDLPPRRINLTVTLLKASAAEMTGRPGVPDAADEMPGVGQRLRKLFRFTSYTRLDAVLVQGIEGQTVASLLGRGYRLEFRIEPGESPRQIRLKGLLFERVSLVPGPGIPEPRHDILRTTINVSAGQPYILAVGKDEAATGALVLVFAGTWAAPGPGIPEVN